MGIGCFPTVGRPGVQASSPEAVHNQCVIHLKARVTTMGIPDTITTNAALSKPHSHKTYQHKLNTIQHKTHIQMKHNVTHGNIIKTRTQLKHNWQTMRAQTTQLKYVCQNM